MNENKKPRNIILSLVGAFVVLLGIFSFILERLIDLYPDVARKNLGDGIMAWLLDLPLPYIVVMAVVVFFVIFIYLLWFNGVFTKEQKMVEESVRKSLTENYYVESGAVGKQETKEIKNYFGQLEDKKKDNEDEMVFPRTQFHREFYIENATAKQALDYMKNDLSGNLWSINLFDESVYDLDYSRTIFQYIVPYGISFHGIKYDLEKRNGFTQRGIKNESFPRLFYISISEVGTEKIRLQVNFETQNQDAILFFGEIQKHLVKMFQIKNGFA